MLKNFAIGGLSGMMATSVVRWLFFRV